MDASSDSKAKGTEKELKEGVEESVLQPERNKEIAELCQEIDKIFDEPDFEENFKRYFAKILDAYKAPERIEKIGDNKKVLNFLFVAAVKRNRVAVAEFLLNQGADIQFQDEHHAFGNCRVYEDDPEIRFALGPYYDHDKTALWHACEFGSLQMVELLLDEKWGASCNFWNIRHFGIFMIRDNAFTVAALNKKLNLLDLLYRYRRKDSCEERGDLALAAGISGHLETVQFVIDQNSLLKKDKFSIALGHEVSGEHEYHKEIESVIFTGAAAAGHINILKFLFEENKDICKLTPFAFAAAVSKRQYEAVLYLFSIHPAYLNWNSEINPFGRSEYEPLTAFHYICRFGTNEDIQMAKLLLHLGARIGIHFVDDDEVEDEDWYELYLLDECYHRVNGLITDKDDDRIIAYIKEERTLVTAVKEDNLKKAQEMLAEGHSIFARYEEGDTLLHIALYRGNLEMAVFIWQQGQDYLESARKKSLTQLLDSAYKPNIDLLELLNDDGFDPIDAALRDAVILITEDDESEPPEYLQEIIDILTQFFGAVLKSLQADAANSKQRDEQIKKLEARFKKFVETAKTSIKSVLDHGYHFGFPEAAIDYAVLAEQFHPKYWLEFANTVSALELTRKDLIQGKITEAEYQRFLSQKSMLCELILDGKLICKESVNSSISIFSLPNSGLDSSSGLDADDSDAALEPESNSINGSTALTAGYSAKRQAAKRSFSAMNADATPVGLSKDEDLDLKPGAEFRKFS